MTNATDEPIGIFNECLALARNHGVGLTPMDLLPFYEAAAQETHRRVVEEKLSSIAASIRGMEASNH